MTASSSNNDSLHKETEIEAEAFEARCRPFIYRESIGELKFPSAVSRLVWALRDNRTWEFNRREIKELHSLIENLLDEVLDAQATMAVMESKSLPDKPDPEPIRYRCTFE